MTSILEMFYWKKKMVKKFLILVILWHWSKKQKKTIYDKYVLKSMQCTTSFSIMFPFFRKKIEFLRIPYFILKIMHLFCHLGTILIKWYHFFCLCDQLFSLQNMFSLTTKTFFWVLTICNYKPGQTKSLHSSTLFLYYDTFMVVWLRLFLWQCYFGPILEKEKKKLHWEAWSLTLFAPLGMASGIQLARLADDARPTCVCRGHHSGPFVCNGETRGTLHMAH